MEKKMTYYTQREWDRVVGIGKVPLEYQHPEDIKSEEKGVNSTLGIVFIPLEIVFFILS